MTGYNHPDDLYADALAKDQKPTGAYRAPAEMPESERKLRTALAYVCHARDLIREGLGDNEPKAQREAKIAYPLTLDELKAAHPVRFGEVIPQAKQESPPERIPKWDPKWVETCPQRALHPMHAETLRDHDERLAGGEDRL
jgi:hypothetical protein